MLQLDDIPAHHFNSDTSYVKCEYAAEIVETNNHVELFVLDRVARMFVKLQQDSSASSRTSSRFAAECGFGRLRICMDRHKEQTYYQILTYHR
jgi:hypothetical protein